MSESVLDQIAEIMRDLFDEYDGPVNRQTTARDVSQWDSLAHVRFLVLTENRFKIRFTTGEIQTFSTLGDLVDLIEQKRPRS